MSFHQGEQVRQSSIFCNTNIGSYFDLLSPVTTVCLYFLHERGCSKSRGCAPSLHLFFILSGCRYLSPSPSADLLLLSSPLTLILTAPLFALEWKKTNKKNPQKQTAQHNKQPCSSCLCMPLLLVSAEMFSQITVLVCICVFRIALWLLRLCNFTDVNKTNSLMLRVHKVSLAPLQQQYRVNKRSNTNRETLTVHDLCFDGVRVRRRVANLFEGQNRMRDNPHTHAYD